MLGRGSPDSGFDEDSRPHPHDHYTRTKAEAEQWLATEAGERCEVVVVRPAARLRSRCARQFRPFASRGGGQAGAAAARAPGAEKRRGGPQLEHFLLLCATHSEPRVCRC